MANQALRKITSGLSNAIIYGTADISCKVLHYLKVELKQQDFSYSAISIASSQNVTSRNQYKKIIQMSSFKPTSFKQN